MSRQWLLHTARTTYGVSMSEPAKGVVLDYWGPSTQDVPAWTPAHPRPSFETIPDVAPIEYASGGTRHVHFSELLVDHGDGLHGAAWTFEDDTFSGSGLTVRLVDTTGTLRLHLHYAVRADLDVVRRWAVIENISTDRTVTLRRALSAGWSVRADLGSRLDYLAGGWGREFTPQQVDLRLGSLLIGSRQALTSHLFAPALTVQALGADGEPDELAGAYGIGLAWSGSWQLLAEAHPYDGLLRVSAGLADDDLAIVMTPGRSFTTPESLGVYSADGSAGVSRAWHAYQRRALSRSTTPEHRPVVYNSWYATTFDVRPDHQLALADTAAQIGTEVFVIDDGWFRGRDTDTRGLGDWEPDPRVFPDGLGPLADGVLARGMRFGLWVEPEAVNPDSDLFRLHPHWIYRAGDRPLTTIRNQHVLDLGRAEVVDWIEGMLRRLLDSYPISYLKWDMNRPVTDGGRPGDPRSGEWAVDHVLGYYRIMRMLRAEFPAVTVEACAGGGGRIDLAVLGLSDVVWTSDETGPRDRLRIQDGFLRAFPPHVMSSWVTDEPGTLDRAPTSAGYRFVVSMAGVLGVGADLSRWDAKELSEAAALVELYKEIRPVVHSGEVTRHGRPDRRGYAVEYAGGPDHGGRIVVLTWDTGGDRPTEPRTVVADRILPPVRIRLTGVDPARQYRLRGTGETYSGAVLRASGVVVPWTVAPDADVLVLDVIEES